MSTTVRGTVQSHTVIRVPDRAHAEQAPFVLLLVKLENGRQVLGYFDGKDPPVIGSRVAGNTAENATTTFHTLGETS